MAKYDELKRYGHPESGSTLEELKAYAKRLETANGLRIEGPNHKVTAVFAAAASLGDLVEHVAALIAEVERLTGCLQKANAQAEHFEREWYLRGDEVEALRKHLTECADSLESEILDRYGPSKDHPAMRRKFECDMQDVIDARATMGKGERTDG